CRPAHAHGHDDPQRSHDRGGRAWRRSLAHRARGPRGDLLARGAALPHLVHAALGAARETPEAAGMTVRSLVRAPALHFLLAGALLFAMRSVAEQRHRAPADGATLSDDELLYREALALGVDRRDPAVRERLVRLGGFVGEERDERQAQEEEARRLGLERSDLVVHRHLAEMMRLAAGRLDAADYPTEAELAPHLPAHADPLPPPPPVPSP